MSEETPLLPSRVDTGATNMPNPNPSAPEGVQAVRTDLVAEVARDLGYAGVSPFEIEDFRIEDVADRLWRAGFRRVSVDDDTVWMVARTLAGTDGWDITRPEDGSEPTEVAMHFLMLARAAVQALLGEWP